MKEFLREELIRLVEKLPTTDPTTTDYHILIHSIEALDSIGSTIEDILDLRDERDEEEGDTPAAQPIPFPSHEAAEDATSSAGPEIEEAGQTPAEEAETVPTHEPTPEPVEETKEETPTYTGAEVRAAMVAAKSKGVDIKAALSALGANNFQDLPEGRYADLMKILKG